MAAIVAENLTKRYGDLLAVDGISFSIDSGETYGLLGPNGAGKTTTMRMLAGLCPITEGRITVAGLDVARDSRAVRAMLGIVTQSDGLDSGINVRANLEVYGELMGLAARESRIRTDEVLEFFLLTDKAQDDVEELSGGMKRRLAIARALMAKPKAIVLDEPSTGLDPESRLRVWEELASLKSRGVTLIMSTHYMDEAEMLCDRLSMMHAGGILDEGTPEALIQRHGGEPAVDLRPSGATRSDVRAALTDAGVPFREVGTVFRIGRSTLETLPELAGVALTERAPNLEDVFLKIAGTGLSDNE